MYIFPHSFRGVAENKSTQLRYVFMGKMEMLSSYVCFSTSEFSVDLSEYRTLLQVAGRKKVQKRFGN